MPNKKIKIFIIAGEVSGDILAEKIMKQLPGATFSGIGGENMIAAGLAPIFPMSDLAVMGLVEVVSRAKTLSRRINQTVSAIIEFAPDIVLTIDSPSFAKRVIKKVRAKSNQNNVPKFYHVVAPQVWAWGASRAAEYAQIFDKLYAFFDFEIPYFTKYGLSTISVGHPIAEGLRPLPQNKLMPGKKTIALIPGSRMSEVKKLLPIFKTVAGSEEIKNKYNFVIPVVETTAAYIKSETAKWAAQPKIVPSSARYDLYSKTHIAIAASGTVSAELAIMHIPAIIVYKMNQATQALAHLIVKTKWASLVNVLLRRTVYPELLGNMATSDNIIAKLNELEVPKNRKKMISELSEADEMWCQKNPASVLIAADITKSFK